MLETAKSHNIGVMFDGHDGDTAVSYGYGLLSELALQGKIINVYINTIINRFSNQFILFPEQRHILSKLNLLNPYFVTQTGIKERLHTVCNSIPHRGQTERQWHQAAIQQYLPSKRLLRLNR